MENNIKKRNSFYKIVKRIFDIVGSLFGLLILAVFCIILFFPYTFGRNKGPMFFKQKRNGQYGKEIGVYKFRSMIVNAEEELKRDKELYTKYKNNNYKLEPEEDPRITKMGAIIRKTSIDELPQFLNVLKGDMSLIGPRPVLDEELDEYGVDRELFLTMKPGITGCWQAFGRSEIPYPERCDMELSYLRKQSIIFDIKIIIETIKSVLVGRGAY